MDLLGRALLAATDLGLVRKVFTGTRPGRALSTRFVAGETLDEAAAVARRLNAKGARVSLDYLGEHVEDRPQALGARDDYLACLDRIAADGIDANISIKLTQLGLGFDDDLAVESLHTLAARAAEAETSVTVDMEESAFTAATLDVYEKVQAERGNVGIAIQAYLHRTAADLDRILPLDGHIRLCKGAYAEPEDIAFQSGDEVDASFDRLLATLMAAKNVRPAVATHDGDRIRLARNLGSQRTGYFELQMLYGVRPTLQDQLLADDLRLRIYVPYGVAWYPYLTRRMAERPANLWFFLRAVAGRR
ncbi:MAG: proline dehydrogenase family protein [Acidimicrobiia bacterium]|nr:proline dehydrogenase family protein [Acidimicrobiia bacterium]